MRALLDAGLDDSYERDPIWGKAAPDHMVVPSFLYLIGETAKPGARRAR